MKWKVRFDMDYLHDVSRWKTFTANSDEEAAQLFVRKNYAWAKELHGKHGFGVVVKNDADEYSYVVVEVTIKTHVSGYSNNEESGDRLREVYS